MLCYNVVIYKTREDISGNRSLGSANGLSWMLMSLKTCACGCPRANFFSIFAVIKVSTYYFPLCFYLVFIWVVTQPTVVGVYQLSD
jgi:hypothetical protein